MLRRVRKDHYAFIRNEADDQSLSLAIPVFGPTGTVVAALEWSGVADADAAAARKQHLPVLQQASHRIEAMLVEVPDLVASLTCR